MSGKWDLSGYFVNWLLGLDLDPTVGLVPFDNYEQRTTWGSTLNTEGYDTVTHAGLQSIPATGPKGTNISFAYTPPIPLHTTKEISQPPLALGIATSNHSDGADIDESLDNPAQSIVANLAPRTWANVTATELTPSPNRPHILRSVTSTHASQNPANIASGSPVVKPSASIAPKVAQVPSHGYSRSYGALEKSNSGTEGAPLSKSAKRKARRSKQLYENSAAKLPVVEVNSTAKPAVVEANPFLVDVATRAKESLDALKEFRVSYMQEHEASRLEKVRKGRDERLDELREFSEGFKLDAPSPMDLLPVVELNYLADVEPVGDLPTEDKSERNENLSSTVEADVVAAFEKFALDQRQKAAAMRLEKVRKGREERLDELRGFSESFKLKAPIPMDLLPILAKDPSKQRSIQEKARKDAEPSLKSYEPSSYEPSLEDAKRSVG